jgi:prepilin-type N-terminal cleavage/methylation domain-containing protein
MTKTKNTKSQSGFTIVELMIAVAVFSMVLILITTGILRFTRQYYKGVIEGQTQDVARAIIDDVTKSIQFSTGSVAPLYDNSGNPNGFCLGSSKRYSFVLNSQVTDGSGPLKQNQSAHAFIADTLSPCSGSSDAVDAQNITAHDFGLLDNAREMLGEHMRLAKFDISGGQDVWKVSVRVVYGDDDLLCVPGATAATNADCQTSPSGPLSNALTPLQLGKLTCRTTDGSQFCAVSELTTTINKRVKPQ